LDRKQRANDAERLLRDETFVDVLDSVRRQSLEVFTSPNSDIKAIEKAHEGIRAVETVLSEVRSRIYGGKAQDKKEGRHRASD
jgi:hypothetical protein